MGAFLSPTATSNTVMFSLPHLFTIAISLLGIYCYYLFRNASFIKSYGRTLLLFILLFSELSLLTWTVSNGLWDIRYHLPLHLCTISVYMCIFMFLFKQAFLFEVVYFFGIGGAIQAIVTPDLFYSFPHFRFIHFFIAHTTIIVSILHMIWIEKLTITVRSFIYSLISLHILAFVAWIVNQRTEANYMFLSYKPKNGSILDFLGPYPYYILSLELVVLIVFSLLYIPFYIKNKKKSG